MVGIAQKDHYVGDEAVQERHLEAEVPDRARYCDFVGRYGEDLAPPLQQRTARRIRGAPRDADRSPAEPQ